MRYLITLFAWGIAASASAQTAQRQVLSSYGGSASSSQVYVSHTAGQLMVGTETAGTITLTQGFEQGQASTVSIDEKQLGKMLIFPNPVSNTLNFKATQFEGNELQVEMIDLSGKIILSEKWNNLNKSIDRQIAVGQLPAGEYLLKVHNNDGLDKVFRFVKE